MTDLSAPHFTNPDKARQYLEKQVWPNGPVCPHCGVVGDHYKLEGASTRPGLYKCNSCREPFTVTVGSIFERSKVPLNKWLLAVHLVAASKKGMSSHQLHRMLGVTYKTAWFMSHRIREAMKTTPTRKLGGGGGIVEADETFWGTKKDATVKTAYHHKMKILSLVERDGEKRSFKIPKVSAKNIRPLMRRHIARTARVMTDEHGVYNRCRGDFADHQRVKHKAGEYSRGEVSTNTVESSFALLKRGLIGTFHQVGEQHLQRYATEFDFRWNHRKISDDERAAALLAQTSGKRLTYRRIDSQGTPASA